MRSTLNAVAKEASVEYELRQQVIEPRRKTFQNLIDRYGDKPASRYEEGSIDIQPTENFHYRPLWRPEKELYDETYSVFRLTDPYSFRDPRQFFYAPYVTSRAALHEAFGKSLEYLGERDLLGRLSEPWKELLAGIVLPLRHYESGAQLISVEGARFAYGSTISQCLTYAAFDRIGNAQMLSRIGIALGGGSAELLGGAKLDWMERGALQGLRRIVEELLVEDDWATGVIAIDLVDRLLYPVLYRHLDEVALLEGAGAYSLLAQHFAGWFADHRRWLDQLYLSWVSDPNHGPTNAAALARLVDVYLPQAKAAVAGIAQGIEALVATEALDVLAVAAGQVRGSFIELGLNLEAAL
jgi:phenol hydroxylase P1 protein